MFVITDITNQLLGLDFLNKFGLITDSSSKAIYDPTTAQKKNLKLSTSLVNFVIHEMKIPSFVQNTINEKYPNLITPHKNTNKNYCDVYQRIDSGSHTPVYAKAQHMRKLGSFPSKNMMQHTPNLERYRFLGMVGFYRKQISKFFDIVLPLSERMRLSLKGSFILNESERQTFNSVIKKLNDISASIQRVVQFPST